MEYNCTFGFDTSDYDLQNRLSSIDGTALATHNASLDYDFQLMDSPVAIDGTDYLGADWLLIPDGEVAIVSMDGTGHMRVEGDALHPHINGTLEVDRFVDLKGSWSDTFQTIRFRGDDIDVRTINPIDYNGDGGWFSSNDPWVIGVTVPKDATVGIEEPLKLPIWSEYILMGCMAAVLVIIYKEHVRGRTQRRDAPKQN